MVVKLRELMGTKYIINALIGKFRNIIDDAKVSGITLDLAGCRFGPLCAELLETNQNVVTFINTEEEEYDILLENNRRILNVVEEELPYLELPEIDGNFDFVGYINSLPAGEYKVDLNQINSNVTGINISLICLIIICRPDITLDLYQYTRMIFEKLCKYINIETFVNKGYTDFILAESPLVYPITVKDPNFKLSKLILPAEICTTQVFDIAGGVVLDEGYIDLVKGILQELTVYVNNTSQKFRIKLIDLLQYKGDAVDDY